MVNAALHADIRLAGNLYTLHLPDLPPTCANNSKVIGYHTGFLIFHKGRRRQGLPLRLRLTCTRHLSSQQTRWVTILGSQLQPTALTAVLHTDPFRLKLLWTTVTRCPLMTFKWTWLACWRFCNGILCISALNQWMVTPFLGANNSVSCLYSGIHSKHATNPHCNFHAICWTPNTVCKRGDCKEMSRKKMSCCVLADWVTQSSLQQFYFGSLWFCLMRKRHP